MKPVFRYYDRQGSPIDLNTWVKYTGDNNYRIVLQNGVENVYISTIWLGIDHSFGAGTPLIFETMVFGGKHDQCQKRYSTEVEAIAGHNTMLGLITTGY